jgi:oligopeptide transport system substrate-binding protein
MQRARVFSCKLGSRSVVGMKGDGRLSLLSTAYPVPRNRACAWLLLLWGLLLVMLGCGQSSMTPPRKEVLIWPNVGVTDLPQLDPALSHDRNSLQAVQLIFSGLVKLNTQLQVVPDLATSWQISPDGKTYTFSLPPHLAFADGTPVTAQDVIYSLDRSLQMASQAKPSGEVGTLLALGHILGADEVLAGHAASARGLTALNAQTLQVRLDAPIAYFLAALTRPPAYLVPQQLIQRYGERAWLEHALGTGPFLLGRWVHGLRMVLTPNPHYNGQKPVLDELDMPFAPNAHAALLAYSAGQYDLTTDIPGPDYAQARAEKHFAEVPLLATDALFLNTALEPFTRPEVRQAFALAVDVQALAHEVMGDSVAPAQTLMPESMPGYDASAVSGLGHNPQRAQQLLASVYPKGTQLPQVTFTYASNAVPSAEVMALQTMWRQALGIEVHLVAVEPSTYQREVAQGQVQLGVVNWQADLADPWNLLALNLRSGAPGNLGQWSNPQFDQWVDQADVLFNDPARRAALYAQAEQLALEEGAWIPLDHPRRTAFVAPFVSGLVVTPVGILAPDWSRVQVKAP